MGNVRDLLLDVSGRGSSNTYPPMVNYMPSLYMVAISVLQDIKLVQNTLGMKKAFFLK